MDLKAFREGRDEPFVGAKPLSAVVDVGGDHDLVGRRASAELFAA